MRAYIATTGTVFVLIIVAHILRAWSEGAFLLKEPSFIVTSLAAIALCVWAFWLLLRAPR